MIEKTIRALTRAGVEHWLINEETTEREERYFIKKREDMRRKADLYGISLTVYRDFDKDGVKMRGSTQIKVQPGATDAELDAAIGGAYYAASFVCNPYFELADPVKAPFADEGGFSPAAEADAAAKALYASDTNADAFINSAEIFAEQKRVRIVSSRGTDVTYRRGKVYGELVAQCVSPQDVELYRDFEFETVNAQAISRLSADLLVASRDRARATDKPPAGEYAVVLSDLHMATLMSAYTEKADAAMVYAKYSAYAVGKNIQGDDVKGDMLNVSLVPDAPFSFDGVPMKERAMIENGVLQAITGPTRFCRYLGIEPTGSYERVRLLSGVTPFEALKTAPCLWPVAFSDFQMDSFTGHFGGEIRLAYLFDGENVRLVTGGSINGSLFEGQRNMTFSEERYVDSHYDGPRAVRIEGVSVSGE